MQTTRNSSSLFAHLTSIPVLVTSKTPTNTALRESSAVLYCRVCMEHLSYDSRLTKLSLVRFSSRSIRSDLVETFRITSEVYVISKEDFYFDDGGRRGHSEKLFKMLENIPLPRE